MRRSIKIFGERNTGTNFVSQILKRNFDVRLLAGGPAYWWEKRFGLGNLSMTTYMSLTTWRNLGWKHAVPERSRLERAACSFVFLTKNPYSWLLSLHRRPYHNQEAARLSFEDFLRAPWPVLGCEGITHDLPNPVELWNVKHRAYWELGHTLNNSVLVRYEDIPAAQEAFVHNIAQAFGLEPLDKVAIAKRGAKSADKDRTTSDYSTYYSQERWRSKLADRDIQKINRTLDQALAQGLGYVVLCDSTIGQEKNPLTLPT